MSLRAKWQHVGKRDWASIAEGWLGSIPTVEPPGSAPDPGVERLPTLLESCGSYDAAGTVADVEGLRRNVLWETIYLMHKAAHVMRASQVHVNLGIRSWAMFQSYHGAYLSAKAVLGFLGIALPNLRGQQALIDLYPAQVPTTRKGNQKSRVRECEFLYVKLPQLDQRYFWELLQRVLRMSTVPCWTQSLVDALLGLSWEEISRARNPYIYSSPFWPLEDLHSESMDATFARAPRKDDSGRLELRESDAPFLLQLSFCTFKLGVELLTDLRSSAPALAWDAERLQGQFFIERNAVFLEFMEQGS